MDRHYDLLGYLFLAYGLLLLAATLQRIELLLLFRSAAR